jgi:hypothetical protein
MVKHRTHLLLDYEQHQSLAQLAKREGRSISDLAREFVQEGIEQRQRLHQVEQKRRLQALEKAHQVRQAILRERNNAPLDLNMSELMNKLRQDRDDQILSRGH